MLKALILLAGSAAARSRTGCPGQTLDIGCPGGTEINITQAMYGRFQSDVCQSTKTETSPNKKCSLPVGESKQVASRTCNGQSSCSIAVLPSTFGSDPCSDETGYLAVEFECREVDFECPGVAFAASGRKEQFTAYRQEGAWATDPLDNEGRVYFLPWDKSGGTELKEFRNLEDLVQSNQQTHYRLDTRADGTGFVVRDRKLYYNKRQSRQLVLYDLERRFETRVVELPDANYYDTSPYSIERNTDIDLAVDEAGLWAIYATEDNNGQIVVSQIDSHTLKIIKTFNTGYEKTRVAEAWMTCGILYAIAADSDRLLFMFDTSTGSHVTRSIVEQMVLPKFPHETTTSVKYDPKLRSIQIWASGLTITYQLRFQPKSHLYPTTTTTTSTTRKTPKTTSRPKSCPPMTFEGLHFPEARHGEISIVPCYDAMGSASWTCAGSPSHPYWNHKPNLLECSSNWVLSIRALLNRPTKSQLVADQLLEGIRGHLNTVRPWDLKLLLELVEELRQGNPREMDNGRLEETLLEVISAITPAIGNSRALIDLARESIAVVQRLLSRISCKLRSKSMPFDFKSGELQCWLEPAETSSELPVALEFDKSAPASAYRSLIKLGEDKWLGSLHTDCDRPVEWSVRYIFDKSVTCLESEGNACKHQTTKNGTTICECASGSGPVSLARGNIDDTIMGTSDENVMIEEVTTAETMLMAVLVLAALLHAASGVASLLLPEASVVDVDGLHSAARAINFVMMIALVTISGTHGKMTESDPACSAISIFIHFMCVTSFAWCLVRPGYLALLCAQPLKNLSTGWWLHLTCFGLPMLITAAAAGTQMFPSPENLCLAGGSMSFTWSAAGPAVILASLSMLLILFSATRLRDNSEYQLHIHQIRSTLLWVGLLTVLLSCEWGLVLLYFADDGIDDNDNTVAIFLAAVALFHAVTSFIYHCLCNIKAQRGCKSVLSTFGLRDASEKTPGAEFFWTSAPLHSRSEYQHTLRPVPDCVQMTYTTDDSISGGNNQKLDQSTMQIQYHPSYHFATHGHQGSPPPAMIINPHHDQSPYPGVIANPTLPKMNGNYDDFNPTRSEFDFRAPSFRQPLMNTMPSGDVEV